MVSDEFEWDDAKAASNARKHGATFNEAATVFGDPLAVIVHDPGHSSDEDRFLIGGVSVRGRLLIVSHTDRDGRVRIIRARPMSPAEQKGFEDGTVP